jgi:hypothetical protein
MRYLLLLLVFLAGCSCRATHKVVVESGFDEFRITGIDQPKHYYVDIVNVRTEEDQKHVYVSKHFNDWRKLPVGTVFKMEWEKSYYIYDDTKETATSTCFRPRYNLHDILRAKASEL